MTTTETERTSLSGSSLGPVFHFLAAMALVGTACGSGATDGDPKAVGGSDAGTDGADTDTAEPDLASTDTATDTADAPVPEDGDRDAGSDAGWVVETSGGPVRGRRIFEYDPGWRFLGIRYAKPPTEGLRWKAPRRPEPREEVRGADSYMPSCPQPTRPNQPADPGPTSEDCLGLNVWTPDRDADSELPVLVWIHGGGFLTGGSRVDYPVGTQIYSGARLAQRGAVVVSMNYRLGPLGFLAHPDLVGEDAEYAAAGNYGFLDQVAALEWVQRNIGAFGGDPDNVTLFGQSAGGISICGHLVADVSRDLFDKAMLQSGSCPEFLRRLDEKRGRLSSAFDQGKRIAKKLGCEGEGISCMRELSAETMFRELSTTFNPTADGEAFGPIVDGEIFEKSFWSSMEAGETASVPIVVGTTADEGTLWARQYVNYSKSEYRNWVETYFPNRSSGVLETYPADVYDAAWRAIAAILGDTYFTCPARWSAGAHASHDNPVYHYLFSHVTGYARRNDLGSFHSIDLEFVFGNFVRPTVTDAERALSRRMQGYWLQFARDGNPGKVGETKWPAYTTSGKKTLEFQTGNLTTRSDYRASTCGFWASGG